MSVFSRVKIPAPGGSPVYANEMLLRASLEHFLEWLTEHGYTDTDWKDEEPKAIDEYVRKLKEGR